MSKTADLVRVAKGARKVAQALIDAESSAVATRVLRLREHGVSLAANLKDALSSTASCTTQPGQPSPTPERSVDKRVEVAAESDRCPPHQTPTFRSSSLSDEPPEQVDLQSSHPGKRPGDSFKENPPTATSGHSYAYYPKNYVNDTLTSEGDKPFNRAFRDAGTSKSEVRSDASDLPPTIGTVKLPGRTTSSSWDESGPWSYASTTHDAAESSDAGDGVKQSETAGVAVGPNIGMSSSRARTVPSTPLARVFGFGQLAAGLAIGTVAEAVRHSVAGSGTDGNGDATSKKRQGGTVKQYVVSDSNAERLAETLCRMRGAALKLGQMLSIQDESVIPPSLAKALDRVRQGADIMPTRQLHMQLEKSFGANWRGRLASFDEVPIAAASIGQVHRARLLDGRDVAMKIQYPGVADSVESDLTNLHRLVQLTNILPPGLYIEQIIKVAREELSEECDYEKEAQHQERFRKLVESDEKLSKWASVPKVIPELSSKEVLTTELVPGVPVDQILPMPQEVRNHVARLMLRCTINELFAWRFMQTDPNWGNFLFDRQTGKMSLIDFGASREYGKDFVDGYLRLVWAAANKDEDEILRVSTDLHFLTGDETPGLKKAHVMAGLVVGEPFVDTEGKPFDFHGSNITTRLSQHGGTFMKHRLTPPPREAYSLHRKLAGAFLMCIKLRASVPCRDILEEVYSRYEIG